MEPGIGIRWKAMRLWYVRLHNEVYYLKGIQSFMQLMVVQGQNMIRRVQSTNMVLRSMINARDCWDLILFLVEDP